KLDWPGRGENGLDAVEIFLRDGIELVIVTAGAADRQPGEGERGRGNDVIKRILSPTFAASAAFRTQAQEARGDHGILRIRRVLIARELFLDELIVRLVFVE